MTEVVYVLVTYQFVEDVSPDSQSVTVSYFHFVSTILPAINLSTAILSIVVYLETLI